MRISKEIDTQASTTPLVLDSFTDITPGRKLIHEHGVSPHIRATLTHDEEVDLLRSRRKREDPATAEAAIWDPQLERAVDAIQGTLQHAKNGKK